MATEQAQTVSTAVEENIVTDLADNMDAALVAVQADMTDGEKEMAAEFLRALAAVDVVGSAVIDEFDYEAMTENLSMMNDGGEQAGNGDDLMQPEEPGEPGAPCVECRGGEKAENGDGENGDDASDEDTILASAGSQGAAVGKAVFAAGIVVGLLNAMAM